MVAPYPIAVIVGSLRRESINRRFANALVRLGPPELEFRFVRLDDLPLYNQDEELQPPPAVTRFKDEIRATRALLFVTPEYNRSIPGVLKNALDHGSRPYGQSVWAGRPGGVIGTSGGAIGTALAQQHLRNILAYLDVPVLAQPEAFIQTKTDLYTATGEFSDASRQFLQGWMDAYVAWVKKHA